MIIIWRGNGILILFAWLVGAIASGIITYELIKPPEGGEVGFLPFVVAVIGGAAGVWIASLSACRGKVSRFTSARTGQEQIVDDVPTLYFLSARTWAWISSAFAVLMVLLGLVANQENAALKGETVATRQAHDQTDKSSAATLTQTSSGNSKDDSSDETPATSKAPSQITDSRILRQSSEMSAATPTPVARPAEAPAPSPTKTSVSEPAERPQPMSASTTAIVPEVPAPNPVPVPLPEIPKLPTPQREWRDSNNRPLTASLERFTSANNEEAEFKRQDGQLFRIAVNKFSAADQSFIRTLIPSGSAPQPDETQANASPSPPEVGPLSSTPKGKVLPKTGRPDTSGGRFIHPGDPLISSKLRVPPLTGRPALKVPATSGKIKVWPLFRGLVSSEILNPPKVRAVAVAGNFRFGLALTPRGTVEGWGEYSDSERLVIPSGLDHVVGIAAGDRCCFALRDDGSVVAWGVEMFPEGQVTKPAVAIFAAQSQPFGVALHADGTLTTIRPDLESVFKVMLPPADLKDVVDLFIGAGTGLAAKRDGTVVSWGYKGAMRFALAPMGNRIAKGIISVAGANASAVALSSTGEVFGWCEPNGSESSRLDERGFLSIPQKGADRVVACTLQGHFAFHYPGDKWKVVHGTDPAKASKAFAFESAKWPTEFDGCFELHFLNNLMLGLSK